MNKAVPVRKKVQGLCWGEILTRLRGAAQNTRCEPLEPSTVKAGCFQVEMLSLTGRSAISLLCQLLLHEQIKCFWLDFKEGRWTESQSQASCLSNTHYSASTTQRVTTDYCIYSDTTCFQNRKVSNTCFNAGRKHLTFYWRQKTWVKNAYIIQDIKLTNYIPYYSLLL